MPKGTRLVLMSLMPDAAMHAPRLIVAHRRLRCCRIIVAQKDV